MDILEYIANFIQRVGFPIFITLYLLFVYNKTMIKLNISIEKLTKIIEKNTEINKKIEDILHKCPLNNNQQQFIRCTSSEGEYSEISSGNLYCNK